MGWIGNKWYPRWPGDTCHGFYAPPEDGSAPIWERKSPDFQGTLDNRPIWVMVNGREIPSYNLWAGSRLCEIELYGKNPPWGLNFAEYFCRNHVVWLRDEEAVSQHFRDNKGLLGQWKKKLGIKSPETETSKKTSDVEVPDSLTVELRAFLEPMVAANEKFVSLWKLGKTGPLIGAAMRAAAGKFDGKYIEKTLKEIVGE